MEPPMIVALLFLIAFVLIVIAIVYNKRYYAALDDSQNQVTDKQLIEYIDSQPDKMIDRQMIMERFGLSKFAADGRLSYFLGNGLLRTLHTSNGMKLYYTLTSPIDKPYDIDLSDEPFITVDDILAIFKHFDFRVSLQEICLVSGLPIKVIKEEMKYFEKEKIVKSLIQTDPQATMHRMVYMLEEPYKSNPDSFLQLKEADLKLRSIYERAAKEK